MSGWWTDSRLNKRTFQTCCIYYKYMWTEGASGLRGINQLPTTTHIFPKMLPNWTEAWQRPLSWIFIERQDWCDQASSMKWYSYLWAHLVQLLYLNQVFFDPCFLLCGRQRKIWVVEYSARIPVPSFQLKLANGTFAQASQNNGTLTNQKLALNSCTS